MHPMNESPDMAVEYLDLDAFKPKAYKHVTIEGTKYGVMHPSDLSFDQWLELIESDQVLSKLAEDPRAATTAGKKKIAMLIPDLPADVLESLNPKRVLMLINFVTTEVRNAAAEQQEKLAGEREGNGDAGAEAESAPAESPSTSAN
jgi:hypothetical protein